MCACMYVCIHVCTHVHLYVSLLYIQVLYIIKYLCVCVSKSTSIRIQSHESTDYIDVRCLVEPSLSEVCAESKIK